MVEFDNTGEKQGEYHKSCESGEIGRIFMLEKEHGEGDIECHVHKNIEPKFKCSNLGGEWEPYHILPMRVRDKDGAVHSACQNDDSIEN